MKKILSMFLVFTLVFSMSLNVMATDITVSDGNTTGTFVPKTNSTISLSTVQGTLGKAASDSVMEVSATALHPYGITSGIKLAGDFEEINSNYYIFEFNYMKKAATELRLMEDDGGYVVGGFENGKFVNDKWYKITVAVDYTGYSADNKKVNAISYIDGAQYKTYNATPAANILGKPDGNSKINKFELLFLEKGTDTSGVVAYIDDFKSYSASEVPASVTATFSPITTGSLSMSGSVATLSKFGTTTADLKKEYPNYKFVAYTDSTMATEVDSYVPLNAGHTLAVEDANNIIAIYTVSVEGLISMTRGDITEVPFTKKNSIATETASGIAGKDQEDVSLKMSNTTGGDTYLSGGGLESVDKNSKILSKYYVMRFNYLPNETAGISLKTANNAHVITPIGNAAFNKDKWNSVLIYVDYSAIDPEYDYTQLLQNSQDKASVLIPDSEKAKVCPVGYVFINGVPYSTGNMPARLQDRFGMWNEYYHPTNGNHVVPTAANTDLRFGFNTFTNGNSAYVDDLQIYQTDTLPVAKDTLITPITPSSRLTIEGDIAKVGIGNSVETLSAAYPGYNFKAYKSSDMMNVMDDATPLTDKNLLIITDKKTGVMAYCEVEENDNSTVLYQNKNYSSFGAFTGGVNSEVSGKAGKSADDTSLHVVSNSANSYLDYMWGNSDSAWDKLNYRGYLVNEFSILNDGAEKIYLGTDENSPVSAELQTYLNDDVWNRVTVITDRTGGENNGKTKTCVNGIAVSDWTADSIGTTDTAGNYKNSLRYYFEAPAGSGIYLDDVRIYETEAAPAIAPIVISGESFIAAGSNFNLVKTTLLSDVEYGSYAIRGYSDSTFTTELEQNTEIQPGNVIVAENKYGAITYFTAREWTGVSEVLTGTPESVEGGSSELLSAPVFGKTGSDFSYLVKATGENAYYNIPWRAEDPLSKYLVYEVNVSPKDSSANVSFGASGNSKMSVEINSEAGLKANAWNKVVNVYNIESGYADTYVNGEKVSENFRTDYKSNMRDAVTFNISKQAYVDDMKIYETAIYPDIEKPYAMTDGFDSAKGYIVDNSTNTVNISLDTKAGNVVSYFDGVSATVFTDNTFSSVISSNENITNGSVVAIATDNMSYSYYTLKEHTWNDIIIMGDIYDEANSALTGNGTATFIAPVSDGGVLYVVQYDENGSVAKIVIEDTAVNGCLSAEFKPENLANSNVKALLLNSANGLIPLCKNKELKRNVKENILVIGNSFACDLTRYWHQIADADGVEHTVHTLDYGGKNINDHWAMKDVPVEESPINFFENGYATTKSTVAASLEKYDYDYVIIQNWGSTKAFYTYSDANYDANWSRMVDLFQYISEREPNAEFLVHATWSFEAGYYDFKDKETRDEIGAQMDLLNERVARETAERLGLSEPIRILSSMSAFNEARQYKDGNGLDLFDTVYYKDGHIFTQPSGSRFNVYQGEDLLSPDDKAAGRISLHRDGYHANNAGRYLIALNAYQTISGRPVSGNAFKTEESTMQSSSFYAPTDVTLGDAVDGVMNQIYDPVPLDTRAKLQKIVDGMKR